MFLSLPDPHLPFLPCQKFPLLTTMLTHSEINNWSIEFWIRPHVVVFTRAYFWIYAHVSLLMGYGGSYMVLEIKPELAVCKTIALPIYDRLWIYYFWSFVICFFIAHIWDWSFCVYFYLLFCPSTQHDSLQFYSYSGKLHDLVFHSRILFHCVYILWFLHPVIYS